MPRGGTATHGPRNPSVIELYQHHLDSLGWSDALKRQAEESSGMPWMDIAGVIIAGVASGGNPSAITAALATSAIKNGIQEPLGNPKFKATFEQILKQAGTLDDFKAKYGIVGNSVTPDVIKRYNDDKGLTGTPKEIKDNTAGRNKYLESQDRPRNTSDNSGITNNTTVPSGDPSQTRNSGGNTMVNPVNTSALSTHANSVDAYANWLLTHPKQGGVNLQFLPGVLTPEQEQAMYGPLGNTLYSNPQSTQPPPQTQVQTQPINTIKTAPPIQNISISTPTGKTTNDSAGTGSVVGETQTTYKPQAPTGSNETDANSGSDWNDPNVYAGQWDALNKLKEQENYNGNDYYDLGVQQSNLNAVSKPGVPGGQNTQGGYQRFNPTINAPQLYGANTKEFDEAANNWRDVIGGKKSYAMEALKAGMATSRKNMSSVMASTVGMNPALKAKSFLGTQRAMEGDVTNQAGVLRAKEAQDAMSGLGKVINDKTTQGLGFQTQYNNLYGKAAELGVELQKSEDLMVPKLMGLSGEDLNNIVQSEHQTKRENIDATLGKSATDLDWAKLTADEKNAQLRFWASLGASAIPLIIKYFPNLANKSDNELQAILDNAIENNDTSGFDGAFYSTSDIQNTGNVPLVDDVTPTTQVGSGETSDAGIGEA